MTMWCGAFSLFTCVILSPAHSNQFFGIDYDKWLHFDTSALLSATITQLEKKWGWEDPFHLLPLCSAILANTLKEVYDSSQPGVIWDWQDIQTGTLGGFFGVGLTKLWSTDATPSLSPRSAEAAVLLSVLFPGGGHFYNGQPAKAWTYIGLEAAALFPVLLIDRTAEPLPYRVFLGALMCFKVMDVLDAAVTTTSSSPFGFHLELHPGRVVARATF